MKDEFHMKLKCEASERVGVRSPESECLRCTPDTELVLGAAK